MTNEKPRTIRESIEAYRRRIAEERFSDEKHFNNIYYPGDNEPFAMRASPSDVKEMLERSGKFRLYLNKPSHSVAYTMTCVPTNTLVVGGREDMPWYLPLKDKNWTGFTIHPRSYPPQSYIDAIDTLETILSIAEKHNVPMTTEHMGDDKKYFVTSGGKT